MIIKAYKPIGILLTLVLLIVGAGCTPSQPLPTLMVLPTQRPNETATNTLVEIAQVGTSTPSASPTPTQTPSITPTHTPSATITNTPTPSRTWTPTPTPTLIFTPTPESDAIVANDEGVNLRKGPHISFVPPIVLLEKDTRLSLLAISPNLLWYKVEAEDGTQGWAYSKLLTVYREPEDLPVVDVPLPTSVPIISVVQPPALPPIGGLNGPVVLGGGGGGGVSVPGLVSARTMQIYQQGLARGNNPRVFAKVGDSITNNQTFMNGYGSGHYNLGSGYASLQDSVSYFSADAYQRDSIAAESAFNAAAVLDPIWAPQGICQPNETPLMCEYRVTRPSVAIILLGSVDVQLYDANAYSNYMNQVVNLTISQGIVPVLTTFAYASDYYPGQTEAFNNVIRGIAAQQQIPLIELQAATAGMPNRGVVEDKFHLTSRGDDWIDLNGEQNQYGTTMRSFLTMQVLDNLRRGLGMN